ncbi:MULTISPECIES: hypothetical protein [unclassified Moorena]|uniref:hypothetical protein n=1 Tax=unclassified Moorena TaxID=2683338 RepID=UPI0012B5D35E|nr:MULTISPECIES: hypothetical protein [unclassified Moorena]NEQ14881.1 hypothetical protein [Moorena sp. SIO3E2]
MGNLCVMCILCGMGILPVSNTPDSRLPTPDSRLPTPDPSTLTLVRSSRMTDEAGKSYRDD